MRQFFLAAVLIASAVAIFAVGRAYWPSQSAPGILGDLSAMQSVAADVQSIAKGGDLAAAKERVADLETIWDAEEPTLRPKDPEAWGRVDAAADAALSALRAGSPDAARIDTTMTALLAALDNPSQTGTDIGGVVMIGDIAVTDSAGHPIPCEAMLSDIRAKLAATTMAPDVATAVNDLVTKATERCNADDDRNADAFSAQALQKLSTT